MLSCLYKKPLANLVVMDLEGCLIPEIWLEFAKQQNNEAFARTTADISSYTELMNYRIALLQKHRFKIQQVQEVVETMEPLTGAIEFLNWVRSHSQILILSDTFYELSAPLMKKLGHPTLFCHNLILNKKNEIISYKLRTRDPKKKMVRAMQKNGFYVIAIGDSFNDVSMIKQADKSFFFKAQEKVIGAHPNIPLLKDYDELKQELSSIFTQRSSHES